MGRLNRLSDTDYRSPDRDHDERVLPYSGDRPPTVWGKVLRFAGTLLGKIIIAIVATAPVGGLFWERIGHNLALSSSVHVPAAVPARQAPVQSPVRKAARKSSKKT